MTDEPEGLPTEPIVDTRPAIGSFPERFELGEEIGRGGMGRVVEARDKMLDRTVALKEALGTDEYALRRFARETQITARLEHPSIVPVYDAGVSPEGSPFYVMRKVTGKALHELVGKSKTLADRLALLPHVLAAAQAVAHAHERGIIHRDLKPANILAGAHGETIVIDWGLAKARGETDSVRERVEPMASDSLRTHAGTVFGTPGFMSPEQHASSDVDERADVYALGATLHFVLAGKLPPAELDGVPRELRAIVDKARAHLDARYRDAGALAEDLSRFMTGQLVAAHDYSTRERITRFVRRYRALVITIAAALCALAIGAWIAVGRVLTARDEAIAQANAAERARAAETERASDLVVSQARLLLATNPTAAIAMVRPLAASSRWREVRAIAAGARASGVARRLPGPRSAACADLSASSRALVCGVDGSIYLYDLRAGTHAIVATLKGRVRAQFAGEQQIVAWVDKTLTVIDIATKAQKAHDHAARILRVDARDGLVYFADERHQVWRLTTATGALVQLPVPGRVTHVAISPDGKRIAFAGEHVWLIDAAHPELVEKVHDGKKFELAWSPNGEHLATIGETHIFDITVHPEVEASVYNLTNHAAILARGMMYTAGLSGFTVGERSVSDADLQSSMAGLHVSAGEYVVAAARNHLRVFDGKHEHQVPLPATPISMLRASPGSPYVLAVCADHILVWNLQHVMPKRIEVPTYSQLATVGRDRAWTLTNGASARSIDLATGAIRELPKLPPLRQASPASGAYVIARPLTSKETWIVRPDGTTETIDVDGTFAISLDDQRALLGTKQRELVLYHLESKSRTTLGTFDAPIQRIIAREVAPRWIVTTLTDGTISRHDLSSGAATQTRMPMDTLSPGRAATAATGTGDVFFATGATLHRWKLDGTIEDFIVLPRPVHAAELLDDERILVAADDGAGYVVRTRMKDFARLPTLGQSYTWGSLDPTLVVTDDRTGGVTVLDVAANAAWKIARATPPGSTPDITSDGAVVIMRDATLDSTAIALWRLDLPTTPDATARWIDDLTNATFDPRTGMLGWPPL